MSSDPRYILISGDKGGTAKSTTAHLAAHGLSLLRPAVPSIVITTDPRERLLDTDGRRYLVLDGRSPSKLASVISALAELGEDPIVFIDGAAARHEFDEALPDLVKPALIIVPYMSAGHEYDRAAQTLREIPTAYGLPSAWSTRVEDKRRRAGWTPPASDDRILQPVPRMSALAELLSPGGTARLPYRAQNLARTLARTLLHAASF